MASPVSETIITDVITALDAITIPDGYNTTIKWTGRFNSRDPDKGPRDLRPYAEVRYGGISGGHPGNSRTRVDLRVLVKGVTDYNQSDKDGPDVQTNLLGFDIWRAITEMSLDTKAYFLTGVRIDTLQDMDAEEPEDGVVVAADFNYSVQSDSVGTAIT